MKKGDRVASHQTVLEYRGRTKTNGYVMKVIACADLWYRKAIGRRGIYSEEDMLKFSMFEESEEESSECVVSKFNPNIVNPTHNPDMPCTKEELMVFWEKHKQFVEGL